MTKEEDKFISRILEKKLNEFYFDAFVLQSEDEGSVAGSDVDEDDDDEWEDEEDSDLSSFEDSDFPSDKSGQIQGNADAFK